MAIITTVLSEIFVVILTSVTITFLYILVGNEMPLQETREREEGEIWTLTPLPFPWKGPWLS